MCWFGVFLDHSREALRQHPQHSRQQAKARVGQGAALLHPAAREASENWARSSPL
jgi:hypothetical protein